MNSTKNYELLHDDGAAFLFILPVWFELHSANGTKHLTILLHF